jgi:acyl-CoA thioesterase-1
VPYVSTLDMRLPYLDDRLHLTPTGHRIFGDAVAARIALLP